MQPKQKEPSTPPRETEQHASISLVGIAASQVCHGACRVFTSWADELHLQSEYNGPKAITAPQPAPWYVP